MVNQNRKANPVLAPDNATAASQSQGEKDGTSTHTTIPAPPQPAGPPPTRNVAPQMLPASVPVPTMVQPTPQSQPQQPPPQQPIVAVRTPDVPTLHDLIMNVVDTNRMPTQKFFLVKLPEDDMPSVEKFDSVRDLIESIREVMDDDVAVFAFVGDQLKISKGPFRYLNTSQGALPLFEVPSTESLEFEDNGWLGQNDPVLVAPTTPPEDLEGGAAGISESPSQPMAQEADSMSPAESQIEESETPVLPMG